MNRNFRTLISMPFQFTGAFACVFFFSQLSMGFENNSINNSQTNKTTSNLSVNSSGANSQSGKNTSDLLILTGSKSHEYLKRENKTTLDNQDMYVITGNISLNPRQRAVPVSVEVWGQGVANILFYEFPENADERLKKTVPTAAQINTLFNPSCEGQTPPGELKDWAVVFNHLKCSNKLSGVLRLDSLPATGKTIGYIISVPSESFKKWEGKINVSANANAPESIPITIEVGADSMFFAMLPSLINLISGAFLALFGGYVAFRLQQKLLAQRDQENKFLENKVVNSAIMFDFFKEGGIYKIYYNDDKLSPAEKIANITQALVKEGIYVLIPRESAGKILDISRTAPQNESHLKKLDAILTQDFGEFMNFK